MGNGQGPSLRQLTRAYTDRNNTIATVNVVVTLAIYIAALIAAILLAKTQYWPLALPLMCVNGTAAVRLYMLQHDCGHGSFFTTRRINDLVGSFLSPFTLTPYKATRYNHNLHHAHIGDLDRRDATEIYVMTVAEYQAAPWWRRLGYRIYRSFFVLFIIGPTLLYAVMYRWPRNARASGIGDVIVHDIMVAGVLAALYLGFGPIALLVWLGSVVIGTSCGVIIPYVQHNFETVYWGRKPDLDFETAAMQGSAVLDFGWFFDLCTANIAYHDLHHLNANIPCYNLKRCHRELSPHFRSVRIGFLEGLGCLRWKLWDEETCRMVPFPKPPVRHPANAQVDL